MVAALNDSGPATVRIAHFSDVHVLSMRGARPAEFLGKRASGALNLALARARHYRVEIFEALLRAIEQLRPDHTVCTGDLVNLALESEFERVHLLLERTFSASDLTVVPGNHDYYARDAAESRRFERHFSQWIPSIEPGHTYPVLRLVGPVAILGLSTAHPSLTFMATGTVGDAQRAAAADALARPEVRARFRLVALHHPLLPDPSRPLDTLRRLTDAERVVALLRAGEVDLVVHGHNHVYKSQLLPGTRTPVIQVASGSRHSTGHMAEFNVYVVENGRLSAIERHVFDPEVDAFVSAHVHTADAA